MAAGSPSQGEDYQYRPMRDIYTQRTNFDHYLTPRAAIAKYGPYRRTNFDHYLRPAPRRYIWAGLYGR